MSLNKPEEFFIANILVGLEYIHSNGILHRDIKPENLVFDGRGYLRITDFGIAKVWRPDNAEDTSGTPGYMGNLAVIAAYADFILPAPEVMCRQNHGVAVDYYALGIIAYECMNGRVIILWVETILSPFRGLMQVEVGRKSENRFLLNKFKLKGMKYLMDGL